MSFVSRMERNAKKMKWYDISLLKITVFLFTLFLVTVWSGFRNLALSIDWHWYLTIAVILTILQLNKRFSK